MAKKTRGFGDELIGKIKGYLMKPVDTFAAETKTDLGTALKYGFVGLLVKSILLALLITIGISAIGALATLGVGAVFITALVGGFVGLLISGLWLHLWAYIFGARQGLIQTIKTVFYAETPNYYLGWIPIVSILTGIWSLVLTVFGLKKLQKMSTGAAIGAVLLSIIILVIIVVAIVMALGIALLTTLSGVLI